MDPRCKYTECMQNLQTLYMSLHTQTYIIKQSGIEKNILYYITGKVEDKLLKSSRQTWLP